MLSQFTWCLPKSFPDDFPDIRPPPVLPHLRYVLACLVWKPSSFAELESSQFDGLRSGDGHLWQGNLLGKDMGR